MNFDQIGKQHVSRRRKPSPLRSAKRSPASFDGNFSQHVWPRSSRSGSAIDGKSPDGNTAGRRTSSGKSAGFSIPMSWMKNLCIVAGILVIGIVGTNWDSIAESLKLYEVSPVSLEDSAVHGIMEAGIQPVMPRINTPAETTAPSAPAPASAPAASAAPAAAVTEVSVAEMPLNLTEMFTWSEYQVKSGDTVSGIASKFSLSSGSLIAFNNLQEAWNIRVGNTLKIPNMDGIPYTVQKNDAISKIAVKLKVPQNAILDANNITSDTILPGQVLFIPGAKMDAGDFNRAFKRDTIRSVIEQKMIFPVNGKITSGYGWREDPVRPRPGEKTFHKAVDLGAKMGDPVKAALDGTVMHIGNNPNLGNFIILKHGEYQTLYAHLSAYSVSSVGETVKQGREIGKIGDTGYTTGPHLHFEVFHNGNRINPLDLLK